MQIGVRLAAFDTLPFRKGPDGVGEIEPADGSFGFGLVDGDRHLDEALEESRTVLQVLEQLEEAVRIRELRTGGRSRTGTWSGAR